MAEPYVRAVERPEEAAVACTLCGEPTVGAIAGAADEEHWPREYPCCPACSYGVADDELQQLLRLTARGPN
jgi:hypothetical protein